MGASATESKLESVIAPGHDIENPARRHRIGISVDRSQAARVITAETERIPEAGCNPL